MTSKFSPQINTYYKNSVIAACKRICLKTCMGIHLFLLISLLSLNAQAGSGPSVKQLSSSLSATWQTLLVKSSCKRKPPQDSQCIQAHHGKTITLKLFGKQVNALILFETSTTADVSGPIVKQQSGFLIGPFNGYAYKVVNEIMTHGLIQNRRTSNNGLKVYAHKVNNNNINSQGIELNKGNNWLDGKHGPWIYHWSALAEVNQVLKDIEFYLNDTYSE